MFLGWEVGSSKGEVRGCGRNGWGNLSLDVRGGSERQRYSAERVLPDGLTLMSL